MGRDAVRLRGTKTGEERRAPTTWWNGAGKDLAGYKVPRYVVFAELPKTSTGKIQKFKLREKAKTV